MVQSSDEQINELMPELFGDMEVSSNQIQRLK